MRVAGLISGTSLDGIDTAIVDITGTAARTRIELCAFRTIPYPRKVRAALLASCNAKQISVAEISQLNFLVGKLFGVAVLRTCEEERIDPATVELVGSHGQTIYHQGRSSKEYGLPVASTLQIGEPALIAEETGVPVVADFRTADMAAGGLGAPLVPFMDYIVYRHPIRGRVALNIGGIGNITLIPASVRGATGQRARSAREGARPNLEGGTRSNLDRGTRPNVEGGARLNLEGEARPIIEGGAHSIVEGGTRSLRPASRALAARASDGTSRTFLPRPSPLASNPSVIACDTGPGNMVIDALIERYTGGRQHFDRNGRMASSGRVCEPLLAQLLRHPFFKQPAPRTAGREEFGREFVSDLLKEGERRRLSPEDIVATASALTADSIAGAIARFATAPMHDLVVSGGGVHNRFLVERLREKTGLRMMTAEDFGIVGDAKEAILFAILAYHSFRKIPANIPSATGARHLAILGKLVYPYR